MFLAMPAVASGQVFLPGQWRMTVYYIATETEHPEGARAVRVTDRENNTLAWVCDGFASALAMEGTGRTWDGRLLNWDTRMRGRACYTEVDPALYPWGVGVRGWALVPYRSLAVDGRFVPLGHTVELPAMLGAPLPDGTRHDGCFVAVDGGGAILGHHIDLFLPSRAEYRRLGREGYLPDRVQLVLDSPRCRGALSYAHRPIPGDPLPR